MFSLKEIPIIMHAPDGRKVTPTLGRVSMELHRKPALVREEINHIRPVHVPKELQRDGKRWTERPSLIAATLLAAVRTGQF